MKTKPTLVNLITIVMLALLVVIAGGFQFTKGIIGRAGPVGRPDGSGQFQGMPPSNGMSPQNGQGFQPGQDIGNQPPDMNNQGGNFGADSNGTSSVNSSQFTAMQARMKLMLLLRYGVGAVVILFGILAAIGLTMQKKWGKVMSILTGTIVLAYTIPTMFSFRIGASLILDIMKVVLAIAVIVLVLLPRKIATGTTNTAPEVPA